jgi:O-antigen/teichoic acid export membrane protein
MAGVAALLLGLAALVIDPAAAGLTAMLAAALVPLLLREHLRRLSFAGFENNVALRLDVLVAALQLGALVALAVVGKLSAVTAFAATGGAAAIGATYWWRMRGRGAVRLSVGGAAAALPGMWRAGRWVLASGVAWAAGLYAYPWLLAGLRGSGAVGVWAAGMGLASLANPVLMGLGNYLAPETAHVFALGGASSLWSTVRRSCGLLTIVMLPLPIVALFFGAELVTLAYGPAYASSGLLVFLLSLHLWMAALAFPISRAFFAIERADLELRANLVGLAVLAALGVWLVRVHGPQGAALGLATAGAAANVARVWCLRGALRKGEP